MNFKHSTLADDDAYIQKNKKQTEIKLTKKSQKRIKFFSHVRTEKLYAF